MKLLTALAITLLSAASQASEAVICQLETECFDLEGCDAADYQIALVLSDPPVLSDMNGNAEGTLTSGGGTYGFATSTPDTSTVLRISPDMTARLVVVDGSVPYAIVYGGKCEAQ